MQRNGVKFWLPERRRVGFDVSRLVISHIDRTLFCEDDLERLMDEGCLAEWDFFGIESSYYPFADIDLPNDGQRLNLIKRLTDCGYGDRILISQGYCTKTTSRPLGWPRLRAFAARGRPDDAPERLQRRAHRPNHRIDAASHSHKANYC